MFTRGQGITLTLAEIREFCLRVAIVSFNRQKKNALA